MLKILPMDEKRIQMFIPLLTPTLHHVSPLKLPSSQQLKLCITAQLHPPHKLCDTFDIITQVKY